MHIHDTDLPIFLSLKDVELLDFYYNGLEDKMYCVPPSQIAYILKKNIPIFFYGKSL